MYQLLHRLFNSLFVAVVCCLSSFFYDFPSVIYSYSIYCFPLFLSLSCVHGSFVRSQESIVSLSYFLLFFLLCRTINASPTAAAAIAACARGCICIQFLLFCLSSLSSLCCTVLYRAADSSLKTNKNTQSHKIPAKALLGLLFALDDIVLV